MKRLYIYKSDRAMSTMYLEILFMLQESWSVTLPDTTTITLVRTCLSELPPPRKKRLQQLLESCWGRWYLEWKRLKQCDQSVQVANLVTCDLRPACRHSYQDLDTKTERQLSQNLQGTTSWCLPTPSPPHRRCALHSCVGGDMGGLGDLARLMEMALEQG